MACNCMGQHREHLPHGEQERLMREGAFQTTNVNMNNLWKVGHSIELLSTYGCVERWMITSTKEPTRQSSHREFMGMNNAGCEFWLFSGESDHFPIGWRWAQDPQALYPVKEFAVIRARLEPIEVSGTNDIVKEGLIGYCHYADYNQPTVGEHIIDWTDHQNEHIIF